MFKHSVQIAIDRSPAKLVVNFVQYKGNSSNRIATVTTMDPFYLKTYSSMAFIATGTKAKVDECAFGLLVEAINFTALYCRVIKFDLCTCL